MAELHTVKITTVYSSGLIAKTERQSDDLASALAWAMESHEPHSDDGVLSVAAKMIMHIAEFGQEFSFVDIPEWKSVFVAAEDFLEAIEKEKLK